MGCAVVMVGICTAHHGARWGPLWHIFFHRMKVSRRLGGTVEPSMQSADHQLMCNSICISHSVHVCDGGVCRSALSIALVVFCVTHPAHPGIGGGGGDVCRRFLIFHPYMHGPTMIKAFLIFL